MRLTNTAFLPWETDVTKLRPEDFPVAEDVCRYLNAHEDQRAQDLATLLNDMAAIGIPLWLTAAKGGGIGGGDVKLCAALGALLGLEKMLFLLILALLSLTASGKLRKKRRLPFAPFVWGAFYILLVVEIIQRSC